MTKRTESLLIAAVVILAGIQTAELAQRAAPQSQQQQAESCSGLGCVFPEAYALSSAPAEYLSFQGQLTSNTGSPITASTVFDLTLWDCQTCTTSPDIVYNETQTITPDSRGLFYIEIGCGASCSTYDGATSSAVGSPAGAQTWPPTFSAAYWLAVRIYPGGSGVAYLTPRIAINGAPYVTGEVAWGQLITFPSACSAGQAVTSIGSTPGCATFMQSVGSTSCGAESAVISASSTTLNCGPDATLSSTSCAASSAVTSASNTAVSCGPMLSVSSTSCAASSAVTSASGTAVNCGPMLSVSSTSCGAASEVTSASGTAVTCGAGPFISTAATVSCASQDYVTTQGVSTAVCNQPFILVGPATTSQIMSTSVFTTVTALQASVAASTYYTVSAYIPYSCSAGSAKFGVTAPTGTTISLNFDQEISGTANLQYQETATSTSGSTSTAVCPASPGLPMVITGYIETSTTAGTFGILFDDATTADTMTIFSGAWLQLSNPAA